MWLDGIAPFSICFAPFYDPKQYQGIVPIDLPLKFDELIYSSTEFISKKLAFCDYLRLVNKIVVSILDASRFPPFPHWGYRPFGPRCCTKYRTVPTAAQFLVPCKTVINEWGIGPFTG
jgi:hypothetical protein